MNQFQIVNAQREKGMKIRNRILIVDDEQMSREFLKNALEYLGYEARCVNGAEQAYRELRRNDYDLVLTDVQMPGSNGLELLKTLNKIAPDTAVVMISGRQQMNDALDSFRLGAYDYIPKPVEIDLLKSRLELALEKRKHRLTKRRYQQNLQNLVLQRTAKLRSALKRVEDTYDSTIKVLGSALDLRDAETEEHSHRVAQYTLSLAKALGVLHSKQLRDIRWWAYLHDIGKIGVPDEILLKPGKLTEAEMNVIRTHPELGYRLLNGVRFLQGASELVLHHHESFDGSGYPHGLKAEQIPLSARLFAVADTIDAMTSDRPYRKALPFSDVKQELSRVSGSQFDPRIVEVFFSIPEGQWALPDEPVGKPVQGVVA